MGQMSKIISSLTTGGKILTEVFGDVLNSTVGDKFFLTRQGMRVFAKKLSMKERNFRRCLNGMEKRGLVSLEERGFVITPRGRAALLKMSIESEDWQKQDWDGLWKMVIFDIPEKKKGARDALRKFLIRKGFYRLQDSVFISPFADLEALNFMRFEYGVSENVNIFTSKSASIDDDHKLKELFNLK